jgi:hypothetical protein
MREGARSVHFEVVRVEARIVSGDALPRQHAPLDHGEVDVARYERGQLGKFVSAPNGGQIVSDGIPPRKWSILIDLLAVLRKWRHYQAPAHKREPGYVAELHSRLFSKLLHKAKAGMSPGLPPSPPLFPASKPSFKVQRYFPSPMLGSVATREIQFRE